ncbi:MAG: hypothetical protein KGL95_08005, partial [Patescibacteria group bacterium]|nr:hypothetical protein [Patescibacteria group bacterium]
MAVTVREGIPQERPQERQPISPAEKYWPKLPTPEQLRSKGYKPESKLSLPILIRLSDHLRQTPATIAGGANLSLLDLYPDMAELWPTYESEADRGSKRTQSVIRKQQHMQQAFRRQVFETAVTNGQMEAPLQEAYQRYINLFTAESARRGLDIGANGREVAQLINDIADGKPNPLFDLTASGTNIFKRLGLEPLAADMVKHFLRHSGIPGFQDIYDILTLQDKDPDQPRFIHEATSRIREVVQEGRDALITQELAKRQDQAEKQAHLYRHHFLDAAESRLKQDLE